MSVLSVYYAPCHAYSVTESCYNHVTGSLPRPPEGLILDRGLGLVLRRPELRLLRQLPLQRMPQDRARQQRQLKHAKRKIIEN